MSNDNKPATQEEMLKSIMETLETIKGNISLAGKPETKPDFRRTKIGRKELRSQMRQMIAVMWHKRHSS